MKPPRKPFWEGHGFSRAAQSQEICGLQPLRAPAVKALGGELKITAKFPEGTVEITQFEDVKKAAAGKE